MKRKTDTLVPDKLYTDVKRDLTPEQLAAVGSVTLSWNGIEGAIDTLVALITDLPSGLAVEVTTRINGFDGKTAIIRKGLSDTLPIPEALRVEIGLALDSAAECKTNRDAVIHAHMLNQSLGHGNAKRGSHYAVLMSQQALDGLYDRIVATTSELVAVVWLVAMYKIMEKAPTAEGKAAAVPMSLICAVRFRDFQKTRRSLPPLPACPDAPPAQIELGEALYQSLYRLLGVTTPPPKSEAAKATIDQMNEMGREALAKLNKRSAVMAAPTKDALPAPDPSESTEAK